MMGIRNRYLHLVILILTQYIYCYLSTILSQVIIFLNWGSGAGSNNDPVLQDAIWIFLFIIPPTLVNLIRFIRNRKKNLLNKVINYTIAEIAVIVCFLLVLRYYGYY